MHQALVNQIEKTMRFLRKHSTRGYSTTVLAKAIKLNPSMMAAVLSDAKKYYPELSVRPWGGKSIYRWMNPARIVGNKKEYFYPQRSIGGRISRED